ncbi:MAG TPA: urate hydroxylase PuuD, partial [Candidatus Acidoferrales bacterium]|nr:urate hydroxylase PuuD [Candidatus Acidoferrales bacterium]
MATILLLLPGLVLLKLNVQFPAGMGDQEQIVLRWLHFVAGITWVGLLYFFNLVNAPLLKALDASTRGKVVPLLMPKALWWFRWAAVVTWLAGFRYFMILAKTDATNAGSPALMWRWLGIWVVAWLVAFVIIHALLRPTQGVLNNGWMLALLIGFVTLATAWLVLSLLGDPAAGGRTLSISVGGGIGTIMFLNVW